MTDQTLDPHYGFGIQSGDFVRPYADDPDEWISDAEGDPMLVLEVGRVCDLTMMPTKLSADWSAAWVLRSDGTCCAYPVDALTLAG